MSKPVRSFTASVSSCSGSARRRAQPQRDAHLRSTDFLDVEHYPRITFTGNEVEIVGARDYILRGALTIRGGSREVQLKVSYLGQWRTPWWEEKDGKWTLKIRR